MLINYLKGEKNMQTWRPEGFFITSVPDLLMLHIHNIGNSLKKQKPCINPLPTNDAPICHDLCELSISLWEFVWGF